MLHFLPFIALGLRSVHILANIVYACIYSLVFGNYNQKTAHIKSVRKKNFVWLKDLIAIIHKGLSSKIFKVRSTIKCCMSENVSIKICQSF
jgi:hypothetical protein